MVQSLPISPSMVVEPKTGVMTQAWWRFMLDISQRATLPGPGSVVLLAGATPSGFLVCDGSAVSRVTYAALFKVIGVTYGAGNGTTTFNVPNIPPVSGVNYIIAT